ncbi:MAG: UDP-3-O-(3-hydroxymyristoyl)glucosamine N-acyltransferase [Planctomycetota bacterium]|jgi:UDP-3-O-[3-hydroxymyristoyl] glucosamine N-acyltransferase
MTLLDVTAGSIAALLDGEVIGDGSVAITGISSLTEAQPGDISFLANPKYAPFLAETNASAVIVGRAEDCPGLTQIVVANPDHAFARVVETYGPKPSRLPTGVHPSAVIGDGVTLGEDVAIGAYAVIADGATVAAGSRIYPHAFIGEGAAIGAECTIYPHATIRERCQLGDRVIIHSGAVIGSDGFGYASVEGVHHKIPQVGIVVIGDDVEIGANTSIDRARFGQTVIGTGTKVDNLVQIAHNVHIGAHCIVVSQVGVAGSTTIGNHVTLAGQSGVAGHLTIGDQVIVAGQSGVTKNVPAKAVVQGNPAMELRRNQAKDVAIRRLPQTMATVKQLEARISELEAKLEKLG